MALQHFYSRVPARLSMYERTDSFDTFIKSSMIDEKFIKDNLLPLCVMKLSANEMNLIRDGKFTTAYAQYTSKNGETLIQSVISYIPLDFTGERSSYMVHSLIYNDEEKSKILSSNKYSLLNKKLFKTNIDEFDITNKNGKPIEDAEEVVVTSEKYDSPEQFATKYSPTIVKRFIYALLQSATPKGKNVYITLNVNISELSDHALKFINSITQIFPYHVRNKMSFITFLTDPKRYDNLIRIKFMPKEFMNIQIGKSYQFDMTSKLLDGIRDEEYKSHEVIIDFLYELLTDDKLREKFHGFYDHIVSQNTKLSTLDIKDFTNVVLLFRQSCGKYDEKFVIPEDKDVLNLLNVYDSYKQYLKEKDKCEILNCIQRYAKARIIIPPQIFAKISKIYQGEEPKVKTSVMANILELIHTDAMREKLFSFIKSNYSKETQKNRSIISEDLSRVFYGGFIQSQILGLFSQYFEDETPQTKTIILERLLLAIRTQSIQDKILEFLDKYYEAFTPNQKERVYKTFYEMIPENDNLTKKILNFINNHFDLEGNSYKKKIDASITELIEIDDKKKTRFLCDLVISLKGRLEGIVINKVFTIWSSKAIYSRYLESLTTQNAEEIAESLVKAWTYGYEMTSGSSKKLLDKAVEALNTIKGLKLYTIIDFDEKLKATIMNPDYRKLNEIPEDYNANIETFYNNIKKAFINNFVCDHLLDAFNQKLRKDGIDYIFEYAETNTYIKECDSYNYICDMKKIISNIKENNCLESFVLITNTSYTKQIYTSMLEPFSSIINDLEDKYYANFESFRAAVIIGALKNYFKYGKINLVELFTYLLEKRKAYLVANRNTIKELSKSDVNFNSLSAYWAYEQLIKFVEEYYNLLENNKETAYNDEETGLEKVINKCLPLLDKDAKKKFTQFNLQYKTINSDLFEYIDNAFTKYNNANKKGFFAKLFGKK